MLRESCRVFRHEHQLECLDGRQAIVLRVVRPKNRSQYAAADLVQDAISSEGGRRARARGIVKRQWNGSLRSGDFSTLRGTGSAGKVGFWRRAIQANRVVGVGR